MRYYCTYFDRNYAVRALALIESLNKFAGDYLLYTLCLDEDSFRIMKTLGKDRVTPIKLESLEAFDPELASIKDTRSLIEYYFTITPCWPLYLFANFPNIQELTYLDADLFFFSDPEPVFKKIADASVALTRHNFSPDHSEDIQYGKFNVGWITWRKDECGLKALNWYRKRCLEWCYDRIEGDKFADQKYLEKLSTFKGVSAIEHIGVNISEWSSNNYEFTYVRNAPQVDGVPVVCYHFQRFWSNERGKVDCVIPQRHRSPKSVLMENVFTPYAECLFKHLDMVSNVYPEATLSKTKRGSGFIHDDLDLENSSTSILKTPRTSWEKDSVIRFRISQWDQILAGLQSNRPLGRSTSDQHVYLTFGYVIGQVAQNRNSISILDWGGAFGHFLLYAKRLFPDLEIDYTCKEVTNTAKYGTMANREAKFVDSDEIAFSRNYDLTLANSSLQYSKDWLSTFKQLAEASNSWIYISRIQLIEGSETIRQKEKSYGSDVDVWLIAKNEFLAAAKKLDLIKYEEMDTFEFMKTPDEKLAIAKNEVLAAAKKLELIKNGNMDPFEFMKTPDEKLAKAFLFRKGNLRLDSTK